MNPDKKPREWYQKKRYYIPLAVFGILTIVGLSQPDTSSTQPQTQNFQKQQKQVRNETITIPAYQQPLEVKEEQPQSVKTTAPQPREQPNYYTNSAGNKVQSPTKYNSAPAGASALCRDGTYSFSQSRRGPCSHHGVVAEWLY